jgi:hypothetical protein
LLMHDAAGETKENQWQQEGYAHRTYPSVAWKGTCWNSSRSVAGACHFCGRFLAVDHEPVGVADGSPIGDLAGRYDHPPSLTPERQGQSLASPGCGWTPVRQWIALRASGPHIEVLSSAGGRSRLSIQHTVAPAQQACMLWRAQRIGPTC